MNNIQNNQSLLFNQFSSIKHGFFGRRGGVSVGDYNSLNCSKYVGDNLQCVCDNLSKIKAYMDVERIITLKQEHTSMCVVVDKFVVSDAADVDDNSEPIIADAIVTNLPNIAIGVVTADCVPVLFYDDITKIIGVAHAGWKGAIGGILESTINKMLSIGADASNICVAIGPCISIENYEVSDDFFDQFFDLAFFKDCFVQKKECSSDSIKYFFNVSHFCKMRLKQCGICEQNIDIKNLCTYSNNDAFFSYRRAMKNSNGLCGRQFTSIAILR